MNTSERLQQYYNFDDSVLEAVGNAAKDQNQYEYSLLANRYNIVDGPETILARGAKKPIDVLRFVPDGDYDADYARVYHMSHAAGIDKNSAMHAVRLFGAQPKQQLIYIGNPSGVSSRSGSLTLKQSYEVFATRSLASTVDSTLRYLSDCGISQVDHLGYSYGADRAAEAISQSEQHDLHVNAGVLVEPVTLVKRSVTQLLHAFARSGSLQKNYINQSDSMPYDAIWQEDSPLKFAAWAAGFLRVSNIAIATVLCGEGFENRLVSALTTQPDSRMAIAWGTSSELTDNNAMSNVQTDLKPVFQDRLRFLPLQGMHHAGVDDIDLHAAIMLQGLQSTLSD